MKLLNVKDQIKVSQRSEIIEISLHFPSEGVAMFWSHCLKIELDELYLNYVMLWSCTFPSLQQSSQGKNCGKHITIIWLARHR